jgi:hypothetical protein
MPCPRSGAQSGETLVSTRNTAATTRYNSGKIADPLVLRDRGIAAARKSNSPTTTPMCPSATTIWLIVAGMV